MAWRFWTSGTDASQARKNSSVIVYRRHDLNGVPAKAKGAYVTPEDFSDAKIAREKLAIKPKWNGMTKKSAFRLKPGTKGFKGQAAPQDGYGGGSTQYFLPDATNALEDIN